MHRLLLLASTTGALLLGACGDLILGADCGSIGRHAVFVEPRDARTSRRLDAVTLVIREGTYSDSVSTPPGVAIDLGAGREREGTYEVEVRRAGYHDWRQDSLRVVRGGECNVLQTVRLVVPLEPLP